MLAKSLSFVVVSAMLVTGSAACKHAPETEAQAEVMQEDVTKAVALFKQQDPGMDQWFSKAAGYAVFPNVTTASFIAGGAGGQGELMSGGRIVGYCHVSKASVGLQAGGQEYAEVIFFETQAALNKFMEGNYNLSASASAVALKSGASTNAKYTDGAAVFTATRGGLELSAAIGGQKFSFKPVSGDMRNDSMRMHDRNDMHNDREDMHDHDEMHHDMNR